MERKKLEELAEKVGIELTQQLKEYLNALNSGTSDPSNFMTMSEIEEKLYNVSAKAKKSYLDVTSQFISELDERELVRSKKESTNRRG
ncbi:MAG: hypothetical protein IK079_00410 [Desulfovibrio sp.]|nr:hypothetical protein [Desulfovibrio sp.]